MSYKSENWKESLEKVRGHVQLKEGSVAEAMEVGKIVNPGEGDKKQNIRIQNLEKVVTFFNLKTDYNG